MYSMYPWDGTGAPEADAPARPAGPAQTGAEGEQGAPLPPSSHELAAALQFALDRRDNGDNSGDGPWRRQ